MGGRGSGRYSYGGGTTNEYQRIDVRYLQRRGYLASPTWTRLNWNRNGEHCASIQIETTRQSVTLDYRRRNGDGEWVPVRYPVYLDWTPCNYGGERAWFRCPASRCGR